MQRIVIHGSFPLFRFCQSGLIQKLNRGTTLRNDCVVGKNTLSFCLEPDRYQKIIPDLVFVQELLFRYSLMTVASIASCNI